MINFKENMLGIGAVFGILITAFALAFGLSIVLAIPVWLLWNWLMPVIFGITKVTLLQAWGLTFLSTLLFKSSQMSKD